MKQGTEFGRLKSKYQLLDILSYTFYTPEVEIKLRSISRATKRILDEDKERISLWSTKLDLVTYQLSP